MFEKNGSSAQCRQAQCAVGEGSSYVQYVALQIIVGCGAEGYDGITVIKIQALVAGRDQDAVIIPGIEEEFASLCKRLAPGQGPQLIAYGFFQTDPGLRRIDSATNFGESLEGSIRRPHVHTLSIPPKQPLVRAEEGRVRGWKNLPNVGEGAMFRRHLVDKRHIAQCAAKIGLEISEVCPRADPYSAVAVEHKRTCDI